MSFAQRWREIPAKDDRDRSYNLAQADKVEARAKELESEPQE